MATSSNNKESARATGVAGAQVRDITPPQPRISSIRRSSGSRLSSTKGTVYRSARDAYQATSALLQIRNSLQTSHQRILGEQIQQYRVATVEAAREISKPSIVRYGMYLSACILMDLWGAAISALNLSGIALIVTFLANIILMIFLWAFGRVLLGSRLKKVRARKKKLEDTTTGLRSDMRRLNAQFVRFRTYARGAIRRSPQLAARVTKVTRKVVRLTKFKSVAKVLSFFTKLFSSSRFKFIAEALPFVQALPWWSIGAIAGYIEHRGEYRDAQLVLATYRETHEDYIGTVDDFQNIQREVIDIELEDARKQAGESVVPSLA